MNDWTPLFPRSERFVRLQLSEKDATQNTLFSEDCLIGRHWECEELDCECPCGHRDGKDAA